VGPMPHVDGVTVADHLCSGEPSVPVVLMSAVPSTEAPAEVPILCKLFTIDHLFQVITAALTRSRHRE
jgi:DNA-binding response OmpR family regulator